MKVKNPLTSYSGFGLLAAALVLVSGVAVAQARQGADDNSLSNDQSQGVKLRGDGTVDDTQPGTTSTPSTTQTQGVKLRGDGTVDDTQSVTGTDDVNSQGLKLRGDGTVDDSTDAAEVEDSNDDNSGRQKGQENAAEHRSAVANFVRGLLQVADREPGGVGEQVREIARQQDESSLSVEAAVTKVERRGRIKTLLLGSDYKNLGELRRQVSQTRNRLQQLNRLLANMTVEEDKSEIQNQIEALEQEQIKLENFVEVKESQMSLFGWLTKMFQ